MIRVGPRDGDAAYVSLADGQRTLAVQMLGAGAMRQAAADLLERADEIELHERRKKHRRGGPV